jgi:hypothetical protein
MSKDSNTLENLNAATEQFAKRSTEEARGAMENYFGLLQQTVAYSPWMNTDFGEKLKGYAEQNVAATHQYVQKLSQAKNFQDIVQIQTEFMQAQLNSFADQARNFGEAYMKAATGAIKSPFNT